ncbi:MAG: cupin domain-containing protein [Actinomycetota bacterium]|nr:cupin domain-containing protein [Actinomycetota bacterium]
MAGQVRVVGTGEAGLSKQGLSQFHGVSAESVGAQSLCAHIVVIPPGGRAKAHRHAGHESAVYVIEGRAIVWYGETLAERADVGPGDFLYIPPGVPHVPLNASRTEPAVALVARTDPNEQESVVLLPELDDLSHLSADPLA